MHVAHAEACAVKVARCQSDQTHRNQTKPKQRKSAAAVAIAASVLLQPISTLSNGRKKLRTERNQKKEIKEKIDNRKKSKEIIERRNQKNERVEIKQKKKKEIKRKKKKEKERKKERVLRDFPIRQSQKLVANRSNPDERTFHPQNAHRFDRLRMYVRQHSPIVGFCFYLVVCLVVL